MKKPDRPLISAIVAIAENRVIGKDNKLPWHLPADLRHFKAITTGNPILMGRKTYQSIGRPLPNRTNIIITRDQGFQAPGCMVVTSLEEAIAQASLQGGKDIFIIGGAEVYKQLMPDIDRIYLTVVHHVFDGDTYFPELNETEWQEVECDDFAPDSENVYSYSFLRLERITS